MAPKIVSCAGAGPVPVRDPKGKSTEVFARAGTLFINASTLVSGGHKTRPCKALLLDAIRLHGAKALPLHRKDVAITP